MLENKSAESSRLDWLDAAKGIAILLVVLGHAFRDEMRLVSPACEIIYQFVYKIHMPVFFCVSGYLYGMKRGKYLSKPLGSVILHRAKALLVPFLTASAIIYVIYAVASRVPGISSILDKPVGVGQYALAFLSGDNPYAFHLWYIFSLFLIFTVTHLFFKAFGNVKWSKYAVFALSLCAWAYWGFVGDLPITILNSVIKYWVYYMAGVMLCEMDIKPLKPVMWALFVIGSAYVLYFVTIAVKTANVTRIVIYLPLLISVMAITACVFTASKCVSGGLKKALVYLGNRSYTIYLLHQPFFCAFVGMVLYNKLHLPILPVVAICFSTSIVMPLLISRVISMIKPLSRVTKVFLNLP